LRLPLTVTNGGVSQTVTATILDQVIAPYATLLVDTGAQLASTVTGWADVTSTAALGGYAIFRQTPRTGPPSEGTVPLQNQFPATIWLPYDNTNGLVMGMALANLSTVSVLWIVKYGKGLVAIWILAGRLRRVFAEQLRTVVNDSVSIAIQCEPRV
jgi:hypothetical protein